MNILPYIPLDEEFSLNLCILIIITEGLGENKNSDAVMDINKAQIFMYWIKNPSKIERAMFLAGKKIPIIDREETYTIKGLSLNVDILFNSRKIKELIKYLSCKGLIEVLRSDGVTLIKLSENGKLFFNNLDSDFFNQVKQHVKSISALKSCTTPKLNKLINDLVRISE